MAEVSAEVSHVLFGKSVPWQKSKNAKDVAKFYDNTLLGNFYEMLDRATRSSTKIKVGDSVQKGQLIGTVESPPVQARLEIAKVNVGNAREKLLSSVVESQARYKSFEPQIEARNGQVRQIETQIAASKRAIEAAKSNLQQARQSYDRFSYLQGEGAISVDLLGQKQQLVDQARQNYEKQLIDFGTMRANYDTARSEIERLKIERGTSISSSIAPKEVVKAIESGTYRLPLPPEVETNASALRSEKVALNLARKDVEALQIRASETGTLTSIISGPQDGLSPKGVNDGLDQVYNNAITVLPDRSALRIDQVTPGDADKFASLIGKDVPVMNPRTGQIGKATVRAVISGQSETAFQSVILDNVRDESGKAVRAANAGSQYVFNGNGDLVLKDRSSSAGVTFGPVSPPTVGNDATPNYEQRISGKIPVYYDNDTTKVIGHIEYSFTGTSDGVGDNGVKGTPVAQFVPAQGTDLQGGSLEIKAVGTAGLNRTGGGSSYDHAGQTGTGGSIITIQGTFIPENGSYTVGGQAGGAVKVAGGSVSGSQTRTNPAVAVNAAVRLIPTGDRNQPFVIEHTDHLTIKAPPVNKGPFSGVTEAWDFVSQAFGEGLKAVGVGRDLTLP